MVAGAGVWAVSLVFLVVYHYYARRNAIEAFDIVEREPILVVAPNEAGDGTGVVTAVGTIRGSGATGAPYLRPGQPVYGSTAVYGVTVPTPAQTIVSPIAPYPAAVGVGADGSMPFGYAIGYPSQAASPTAPSPNWSDGAPQV
jgi:hypothetical protein